MWEAAYEHPIYLVTTHADLEYALALHRRRAQIETYFSDQKSSGFRINRSHISDPTRLARLLIATTLAYLWVVYLGWWTDGMRCVGASIDRIAVISACSRLVCGCCPLVCAIDEPYRAGCPNHSSRHVKPRSYVLYGSQIPEGLSRTKVRLR